MKPELTKFLLEEYKKAELEPQYINLCGKKYLIPADYVMDFKDYQKAFISDFFDDMRADYDAYKKNGEPVQYVSLRNEGKILKLVVPYNLQNKNKSAEEIVCKIFENADKKYERMVQYSYDLTKTEGVRTEPTYALRQRVIQTLETAKKKTNNNPKWTIENLKSAARRWIVRAALAASIGGAGYAVFSPKNTEKGKDDVSEMHTPDLSEYNKKVFDKNLSDVMCVIAFVEDYREKAYDDGLGVCTIGFGTTFYLNNKGEKTGKVKPQDKISSEEAVEQMRRYLNFIVLPQIRKKVKVCIDDESMKTLVPLCYLLGEKKFEKSLFLQELNKGVVGKDLANTASIYRLQGGVCKRLWLSVAVSQGNLSTQELLNLPIASCYKLHKKDVFEYQDNKLKKGENEQAFFKTDPKTIDRNIKKMRYWSTKPKLKDVLPPTFVKNLEKPAPKLLFGLKSHAYN